MITIAVMPARREATVTHRLAIVVGTTWQSAPLTYNPAFHQRHELQAHDHTPYFVVQSLPTALLLSRLGIVGLSKAEPHILVGLQRTTRLEVSTAASFTRWWVDR